MFQASSAVNVKRSYRRIGDSSNDWYRNEDATLKHSQRLVCAVGICCYSIESSAVQTYRRASGHVESVLDSVRYVDQ